jgi:hypothetical protein
MVRYSNNSFFSAVSTSLGVFLMNTINVSNTKSKVGEYFFLAAILGMNYILGRSKHI